ncbi:MAG TPA: C4-dicarboxylate ABC transporter substrate-binding protein [Deltaproteobacteria bacterium]|nr:C4-dicarboxylate ABC transporter substrate-binding protein [Deltaproteobacteria bacterium]HCP48134.1 C4-dicarboxylate ABC transporter substrate-binding protein [Deltaproteobacteria bacterium]
MRVSLRVMFCAAPALLMAGAFLLAPGDATSQQPEFTLNFGTVAPDNTPWSDQLVDIKKRVEKESNGRIKVRLFTGGALGGEVEQIQDIRDGGRLQGGGFTTSALATGANVPELDLPELPYLFRNNAEADHVLDTVLFEPMQKRLRRRGIHMSMWAQNGWRSFYTKKPVRSLADLQSHKMRTQESDVHKAMYKALGIQAFAMSTAEVLDALSRGTVDGFDNTALFAQASGWFEPVDHLSLTRHIFQPAAIVYSKTWFDALPEDLQKIVNGNRLEDQKLGRRLVRELEPELIANFKDMDVQVHEPSEEELKPIIAKARTIHSEFRQVVGGDLLDAVYAALAEFRKSTP